MMESKTIEVLLYADEIKKIKNAYGKQWMYLGILAIPLQKMNYAICCLEDDRKKAQYFNEIKSTKLTQRNKIDLAKLWIERIMWDNRKCFHFYILGINLNNILDDAFGDYRNEQYRRKYNRFFRSSVSYALKYFFGNYDTINVITIFHDRTDLEEDEYFDWHTMWRIGKEEDKINFKTTEIVFIDSDHRKEMKHPTDSHFIQLIDTILGITRQCLDYTSKKEGINEVAEKFYPLIDRLTDNRFCRNRNSKYCYHNRCSISFFPSKELKIDELNDLFIRSTSTFYVDRKLIFLEKHYGQMTLDFI